MEDPGSEFLFVVVPNSRGLSDVALLEGADHIGLAVRGAVGHWDVLPVGEGDGLLSPRVRVGVRTDLHVHRRANT